MTIKGIPDPNQIADPNTRAWARAITERLNTLLGHTGAFEESVPTWGALKAIGAIGIDADRPTSPYRKPITEPAPLTDRTPPARTASSQVVASATFDATAGKAIGTHTLSISLPFNSYVTYGYIVVGTTFTSATDAGTIAIGVETDDATGIKSATAISAGENAWDAGTHPTDQTGAAANFTARTTAARSVIVTVGTEALTAGVFTVYIYYSTGA